MHLTYDGTLESSRYFPGKLFSVAPEVMAKIAGVLARNERLVTFWRHPDLGVFALVLVGAISCSHWPEINGVRIILFVIVDSLIF